MQLAVTIEGCRPLLACEISVTDLGLVCHVAV
jgi:hypothetical protein